jgi:uncharacterized repeat protein (TIGR03809 family)
MTNRLAVARGRDIVARWCALAEQRLEYLTELFETGRWRRFHSETAFLENVREAKAAVETWRDLLTREASLDNSTIDMSWLSRVRPATRPRQTMPNPSRRPSLAPITPPSPRPIAVKSAEVERISSDEAPSAPVMAMPVMEAPALKIPDLKIPALDNTMELLLDIDAIEQRYPLLRNAM